MRPIMKHVRLLFDIAHYKQGGGDPVAALREYREWIDVLHLKDVARQRRCERRYEFVELGRGHVDIEGVFKRCASWSTASGRSSSSIASSTLGARRRKRPRSIGASWSSRCTR